MTGLFDTEGWWDGRPYARNQTFNYFIWFNAVTDKWTIGNLLGTVGTSYWEADAGIIGTYTPMGAATGVATVAKGVYP